MPTLAWACCPSPCSFTCPRKRGHGTQTLVRRSLGVAAGTAGHAM